MIDNTARRATAYLDQTYLQAHLPAGLSLVYFQETDSTNNQAKAYAYQQSGPATSPAGSNNQAKTYATNLPSSATRQAGSTHGSQKSLEPTLFLAQSQTAGRGRYGRTFYSPSQTGIYLSLLYPINRPDDLQLVTFLAAVASQEAIAESLGIQTQIKWVNDLYKQNLKVAGILCEAFASRGDNRIDAVIIGIGINVQAPDHLSEDLANKVGYLTEGPADYNGLVLTLADKLLHYLSALPNVNFMATYKANCLTLGRWVTVTRATETFEAYTRDLAPDGSLLVDRADGNRESLAFGNVSVSLGAAHEA